MDDAFTPPERAAIVDALNTWQTGTDNAICHIHTNDDPTLQIIRITHRSEMAGWDSGWANHIGLYRGEARRGKAWLVIEDFKVQVIRNVATHEIGHYLELTYPCSGSMCTHAAVDEIEQPPELSYMLAAGTKYNGPLPAMDVAAYWRQYPAAPCNK